MPVAKPASTSFNQVWPRRLLQMAAMARKAAARAEPRVPTPQQALEKKLLLSSAAMPTSRQTMGRKPSTRAQNAAARPATSTKIGARNLAVPSAPSSHQSRLVKLGAATPRFAPSQLESIQMPRKLPGRAKSLAARMPSGPSLEKRTNSGLKL